MFPFGFFPPFELPSLLYKESSSSRSNSCNDSGWLAHQDKKVAEWSIALMATKEEELWEPQDPGEWQRQALGNKWTRCSNKGGFVGTDGDPDSWQRQRWVPRRLSYKGGELNSCTNSCKRDRPEILEVDSSRRRSSQRMLVTAS